MLVPDPEYCSDSEHPKGAGQADAAHQARDGSRRLGRYAVDHRALLFGSRFGQGLKVNCKGQAAADFQKAAEVRAEAARAELEAQNEDHTEQLQLKVSHLKQVTHEIRKEVVDSTSLLDDMVISFSKAQSLFLSTMGNLRGMTKQAGGRHMCRLAAFFVVLLVAFFVVAKWAAMAHSAPGVGGFLAPSPAPAIGPSAAAAAAAPNL